MGTTQDNRLIKIFSPLGENVLLLNAFQGEEGVSQLFSFKLDLLSDQDDIDATAILGQKAYLTIAFRSGGDRYVSGYIVEFVRSHRKKGFRRYTAELVPGLWFLQRRTNSRIFENKNIPQIIEQIFEDYKGLINYKTDGLAGNYPQLEYCVQYRESDFNFISRLMQSEGIFYFFQHEHDDHILVFGDNLAVHQDIEGPSYATEYHIEGATDADNYVNEFQEQSAVRSTIWTLKDFNFKTYSSSDPLGENLKANATSSVYTGDIPQLELYDYPGSYQDKSQGNHYAKIRAEEEDWQTKIFSGESGSCGFSSGQCFELSKHILDDFNQKYLLLSISHKARSNYKIDTDDTAIYANSFTCIPSAISYRPPRTTPKPIVTGPQTAIVVGSEGEEIEPDEYGRVKVHFHWEREGKSSCWIRVSQTWAGKGWGAMHIPRIGQEVIVEFLEGDPDQPIITGRVYNGSLMPPYDLDKEKDINKSISTLKSNSTKGGDGFNEFRMQDLKGKEEVYLHAQTDHKTEVNNDQNHWVGHNRTRKVDVDESVTIGGNQTVTIHQNKVETVYFGKALTIGGAYAVSVGAEMNTSVGLSQTEEVGLSKVVLVGKSFIITIGDELDITVGESKLVMKSDGSISMTGTKINIEASGPTQISGKDVDIN